MRRRKTAILFFLIATIAGSLIDIYVGKTVNFLDGFLDNPQLSNSDGGTQISFKQKKDSIYISINESPFQLYHNETFYFRKSCKIKVYYKYGAFTSWTKTTNFNFIAHLNEMFAEWYRTGDYKYLGYYLSDDTKIIYQNQFVYWKDYKYSQNIEKIGEGLLHPISQIKYKNEAPIQTEILIPYSTCNIVNLIIAQ